MTHTVTLTGHDIYPSYLPLLQTCKRFLIVSPTQWPLLHSLLASSFSLTAHGHLELFSWLSCQHSCGSFSCECGSCSQGDKCLHAFKDADPHTCRHTHQFVADLNVPLEAVARAPVAVINPLQYLPTGLRNGAVGKFLQGQVDSWRTYPTACIMFRFPTKSRNPSLRVIKFSCMMISEPK